MWEKIGEISVTNEDLRRVPKWVQREIDRLYKQGKMREALNNGEHFILKGKTYLYSLHPSSQGAADLDIYRRKRGHRRKTKRQRQQPNQILRFIRRLSKTLTGSK